MLRAVSSTSATTARMTSQDSRVGGDTTKRRFKMEPAFDPNDGANGWQISNLPVLTLAPYLASVEMFNEIGMDKLIQKRDHITSYLEYILQEIDKEVDSTFEIITPADPKRRHSSRCSCMVKAVRYLII
jgi:kynureninase